MMARTKAKKTRIQFILMASLLLTAQSGLPKIWAQDSDLPAVGVYGNLGGEEPANLENASEIERFLQDEGIDTSDISGEFMEMKVDVNPDQFGKKKPQGTQGSQDQESADQGIAGQAPSVPENLPAAPDRGEGLPNPNDLPKVDAQDDQPANKGGDPNLPQTDPNRHYNNPRPRNDNRQYIPQGAFGEDGFGNNYVPASLYSGCGHRCGDNCEDMFVSFDNIRHYSNWMMPRDKAFRFGQLYLDGHVSAGGTNQNQWPITSAVGTGAEGDVNASASDFGMNQLYLSFGREVHRGSGWDLGANVDLLYGTDYLWASSLGLESRNKGREEQPVSTVAAAAPHWNSNAQGGYSQYGLAMPQLYGEIYAPLLSGLDLKLGHFYAPMGHESVQSTKNFFYTHSYSFLYGQPHTLTGLLGDLRLCSSVSLISGFSQGWDAWSDNKGSLDVLAGLTFKWTEMTSLSFFLSSGSAVVDNIYDFDREAYAETLKANQTSYSLVYQHRFSDVWTWVLEHDLGSAADAARTVDIDGNYGYKNANWYSVVNYLYYQMSPNLTLGFRAEWFKDRNYSRVMGVDAVRDEMLGYQWTGDNFFDFSLGLNWDLMPNITIRPEVRYDYADLQMTSLDGQEVYQKGVFGDDGKDSGMWTVGTDVRVQF